MFTEEEFEYMVNKLPTNRCIPMELPDSPLYLLGITGSNTILMKKNENSETLFSSRFPDRTNKYIADNLKIGTAYNIKKEWAYKEEAEHPFLYTYWKRATLTPLTRSDFNLCFEKFESPENTLKIDTGWSNRYEWADENGIYVLFYEHGFKIGISKNLRKRIKNYDKPWNAAPISTKTATCTYSTSLKIEKFIKKELKHFTLKGSTEFFYTSCVDESHDILDIIWEKALKLL